MYAENHGRIRIDIIMSFRRNTEGLSAPQGSSEVAETSFESFACTRKSDPRILIHSQPTVDTPSGLQHRFPQDPSTRQYVH